MSSWSPSEPHQFKELARPTYELWKKAYFSPLIVKGTCICQVVSTLIFGVALWWHTCTVQVCMHRKAAPTMTCCIWFGVELSKQKYTKYYLQENSSMAQTTQCMVASYLELCETELSEYNSCTAWVEIFSSTPGKMSHQSFLTWL